MNDSMTMTAGELLEMLQEAIENYGEDLPVRLATQPAWPFACSVTSAGVPDPDPLAEGIDGEAEDDDPSPVFYIAEAAQIGYLPGYVADHLGWR